MAWLICFALFLFFRHMRIRAEQRELAFFMFVDSQMQSNKNHKSSESKPIQLVTLDLRKLGLKNMPSTVDELRSAYKKRMRLVHPDMGGSNEMANAVNQARENLENFYMTTGKLQSGYNYL